MSVIRPLTYTTNRIKDSLGIDDHHLRELMSVNHLEFNSFKSDFAKAPPWAIHSLAVRLGLSMENIVTGHIDYETLREHFKGNLNYLPKRYQTYKESRMRTLANLLSELPQVYQKALLNKLQLNTTHFKDLDQSICGLALIDAQSYIRKLGFPVNSLEATGYSSSQKYKERLCQGIDLERTSVKKLFDYVMVNVNHSLERNMWYHLSKKSQTTIEMKVTTRESLQDSLKIKHFGALEHCANIKGWALGISHYKKDSLSQIKKLSCVHQGDDSCRYEIDYAFAH